MQQESKFNRFVVISAALHASLLTAVFLGPGLLAGEKKELWGFDTGMGESIRVGVVESLPGIPLPSPAVVQEAAVPTESETLHPPEPAPKPVPVAAVVPDVLIPSKTAPKPKPDPPPAPPASSRGAPPAVDAPPPSNAIPGAGGKPAVPYGQPGTGTGPASFGDEAFGRRFGTYVTAMTNAIREKWQQPGTEGITPGKAPKVYVTFTIDRNGKVSKQKIQDPSGNNRLDASALRAVMAAVLPPLPTEYTGSSVDVRFYFEYGR